MIMRQRPTLTLALAALLCGPGCIKWFKGTVATGIARLTVRNVAAIAALLSDDDVCGFKSQNVIEGQEVQGEVGGIGTVIWRVNQCELNLPELTEVMTDCHGDMTMAQGRVIVSAERIVQGRLTGETETPVLPTHTRAATIKITEARFEDFYVEKDGNGNALTMVDGSVAATIRLTLAQSEIGLCSISTPNATFEDIVYGRSDLHVRTPDRSFDAEVDRSNFRAQNGTFEGEENHLDGTLTVWGAKKDVPVDDDPGLDPDYDRAHFDQGYACTDEMIFPVSYACELAPRLSHAMARLSMRTFAYAVAAANADLTCGFESPAAKANATTSGALGRDGGSVTYRVQGCTVNLGTGKMVKDEDCMGVAASASGTVTFSGTKTVRGILTGDPDAMVIPTSMDPAQIEVTFSFRDFAAKDSDSDQFLTVRSGQLSGTMLPRMAKDRTTGVCSMSGPTLSMRYIRWLDGDVVLHSGDKRFRAQLATSGLDAWVGPHDQTNRLSGAITFDGTSRAIPDSDPDLDPDYDPEIFEAAYACNEDLEFVRNDQGCDMVPVLAQAAARLVVKNFAVAVKAVDLDTGCGYGSIDGLIPSGLTGSASTEVTATWDIEECMMGHFRDLTFVETDCDGQDMYLDGRVEITGTKTVTGKLALGYPPILPQSREEVRMDMHGMTAHNYAVLEYAEGSDEPGPYMTIHEGTLSGTSFPVTGEAADTLGAYFIKTPVAGFAAVRLKNAEVTISSGARTFKLDIDDSNLKAFNGSFGDQQNWLKGSITIGGRVIQIPTTDEELALDPEFDQDAFDDTYVCRDNLLEPVPAVKLD